MRETTGKEHGAWRAALAATAKTYHSPSLDRFIDESVQLTIGGVYRLIADAEKLRFIEGDYDCPATCCEETPCIGCKETAEQRRRG